jgi:hypothetical protein
MSRYQEQQQRRKIVAWYHDLDVQDVPVTVAEKEFSSISQQFQRVIEEERTDEMFPLRDHGEKRDIIRRTNRLLGGQALNAIAQEENVTPESISYTVRYALRRLGVIVRNENGQEDVA